MISKKGGNALRAMDLEFYGSYSREEINPPEATVLNMGTQYLLYRTDNRFAVRFCCCWRAVPGFDSHFLCDVSFLVFPKSTATHGNHMKCVCALLFLVLVVQIVHTKKP